MKGLGCGGEGAKRLLTLSVVCAKLEELYNKEMVNI